MLAVLLVLGFLTTLSVMFFSPHKEVIQRVRFLKNTSRYVAISKVGIFQCLIKKIVSVLNISLYCMCVYSSHQ